MQEKLRIIHIVNVRWFNATAWYGLYLSRLMKDAGHEVLVLGLGGTDSFAKAEKMQLSPVSLPLVDKNPLHIPALFSRLSALLAEFKPHIVNCHRGEGFPLWVALKKKYGFKLVRTRGDQRLPKAGIFNRYLYNTAADAVIATNSRTACAIKTLFNTPDDKLSIILGGVNRNIFRHTQEGREKNRDLWGFSEKDIAFGILGRFDYVKGQKELIRAFSAMQKRCSVPVKLVLAGFSTEISEEDVAKWVHEAGLDDVAVITGRSEDVSACISALDVGVVASLGSEAIARAALEIMSCHVPLVSTNIGVMPDLLPDWAMVTPGDNAALSALLLRAAEDAAWRDALKHACMERISTLSGSDFLEASLDVYYRLLDKSK